MTTEKNKPLIMATDEDRFKYLMEKINTLPNGIFNQIEKVENGLAGIACTFKKQWNKDAKIILPNDIRKIIAFDDYIGCYGEEFFYKIPYQPGDSHPSYLFIPLLKETQ